MHFWVGNLLLKNLSSRNKNHSFLFLKPMARHLAHQQVSIIADFEFFDRPDKT
jgi:hypothetical protein